MKLVFDTNGNEKQKKCIEAWVNPSISEIIYGGSKGSAKSYTGCSLIFGDALMYPGTHYWISRKTLKDIRSFTIPSIYEVFDKWGLDKDLYLKYNGMDHFFSLPNESRVYLLDAKYIPSDPMYERFGSMQFTRGWIEEAGEFKAECKENLMASLGRWKNDVYNLPVKLLQTCNPSKNYLYKEYKLNKTNDLPDHKIFIQAFPQDNKMLPNGYIENLERTLTGSRKQRLLYGNWEYDDDPMILVDFESIQDVFNNEHVDHGQKYITVDVARFGNDKTVIRYWNGWRCEKRIALNKSSITQTAEAVKKISREQKVPIRNIIVDEDGVGGGVVDILKCKGFVANSRPAQISNNDNYDNLKSQCAFFLAEKIKKSQLYDSENNPETQELIIEELEQLKQKDLLDTRKNALISKDEMKGNIGRSPDDLDTYIMRAYFDLKPQRNAARSVWIR